MASCNCVASGLSVIVRSLHKHASGCCSRGASLGKGRRYGSIAVRRVRACWRSRSAGTTNSSLTPTCRDEDWRGRAHRGRSRRRGFIGASAHHLASIASSVPPPGALDAARGSSAGLAGLHPERPSRPAPARDAGVAARTPDKSRRAPPIWSTWAHPGCFGVDSGGDGASPTVDRAVPSRSSAPEAPARRPRSVARRGFSPSEHPSRPRPVADRSAGADGHRRRARPFGSRTPVSPPASTSRRPPRPELVAGPRTEASRRSGTGATATGRDVEPNVLPTTGGPARGSDEDVHAAGTGRPDQVQQIAAARVAEDDEVLRPDGGHGDRRRDRTHRDLNEDEGAHRSAPVSQTFVCDTGRSAICPRLEDRRLPAGPAA